MDSLENIYNRVDAYTSLSEKIQTLKRKCNTLCSREADIIVQLQNEESSSAKKPRNEVEDWLMNVGRTRNGVQGIELEMSTSGVVGRIKLINRVQDLTDKVAELMEQGQFQEGLTLEARDRSTKVPFLTTKLVGRSFQRNLEVIWERLRIDEVLIIGIWGMGGVGKTSLVTHIYNRVNEHSCNFDHVYWVTVSKNHNIHKLQDDIARAIRFDISFEDDGKKRAAMLSMELTRRKRSVVILDDVWNNIRFERVGIPVAARGCKLIITTRSLDVCRRLSCHEKIKIEPLPEEEARDLFMTNLGDHTALSTQAFDVAKSVASECAGLPLGIITVASCMREVNDVREWNDTLQALKESKVGMLEMKEVFEVLKLSYSCLKNPKVQQCFLYCALYPEGCSIKRGVLIQCLIDEGIIERMRSRDAEFDRGHAMLNKLVNSCLLESVACNFNLEGVKMHDLVRDMAINMSPQLMVKVGMELDQIPNEEEWSEDLERVSLMNNKIEEIVLGASPRCPKLLTLFLSGNHSLKRIDNSFFKHMPSLQLLDLSDCRQIEELPASVSNLKNLCALVLRGCWKLQRIPSLAELTSLKRLDLFSSGIAEVPRGIERLINLTYLDLRAANLEVLPTGILPKLSQLEYLKFDHWGVKIKGEELISLERLSTFQGRLTFDDDVNGFKEYVVSRRQRLLPSYSYRFRLDEDKGVEDKCSADNLRKVRIEKWNISVSFDVATLEALLNNVQSVEIVECNGARSLSDLSWMDNATRDLKECYMSGCNEIVSVGSFSTCPFPHLFQTLEKLELTDLWSLRDLFELQGEVSIASPLANLKSLTIRYCPTIKKLFRPEFLPSLRNLQEIVIADCMGLEEIVAATNEEEEETSIVEHTLPNLRALSLFYLPNMKTICAEPFSCGSLAEVKVKGCPKLKRIPLSPPLSLRSIKVGGDRREEWWESLQFLHPNDKIDLQRYLEFT